MKVKSRLDRIEAALTQCEWQYIVKIDDRHGAIVTDWEHTDGTIYPFNADLSHLKGVNVLFGIYAA